ncbi:MAG TPA: LuxR C-terminal-related transcriptional regulator [Solirubrobacterales bacterium]|nr:LuxR C-terminal-related transcriptional regulator [Solirubrobacterales bacterium]
MTEDRNQSARGHAGRTAANGDTAAEGQSRTRGTGSREPGTPLSVREREILGLLAGGESGAQIAEALVLSPETVRTHIRNAMSKLGATSRAQAVAIAVQRNEIGGDADPPSAGLDRGRRTDPSAPRPATPAGRTRARTSVGSGQADATVTALLAGLVSLYDVDGGTIFLAEEDGLSLRRTAALGGDEEGNGHHPDRVLLGEGPLGRAALERRAQLLHGSGSGSHPHGRSTICAPMVASGKLVGVISLTTRPSRLTGRGELLLLQAFASRVGEVLLSPGSDRGVKLKQALERFRASWSTASGAV